MLETKLALQGVKGIKLVGTRLESCDFVPSFVTIPYGITSIGMGCFSGQNNLERIFLPSSIIDIESLCFANCTNLRVIKCYESLRKFERILKYGNNAEVVYKE